MTAAGDLEKGGLGVAKWSARSGACDVLECTWYGNEQLAQAAPRNAELRCSDGDIIMPGRFRLTGESVPEITVDAQSAGPNALSITVSDDSGAILARGLGLADPDMRDRAIMISWWTGETEPYGVVKYTIEDADTVRGYYISKMTPDDPGVDIAKGSTAGGFPGDYVLNSREVNGRTWGPHNWSLSARGNLIDLTWEEHGRIFCRGVGMFDPDDARSIIATYIPV